MAYRLIPADNYCQSQNRLKNARVSFFPAINRKPAGDTYGDQIRSGKIEFDSLKIYAKQKITSYFLLPDRNSDNNKQTLFDSLESRNGGVKQLK